MHSFEPRRSCPRTFVAHEHIKNNANLRLSALFPRSRHGVAGGKISFSIFYDLARSGVRRPPSPRSAGCNGRPFAIDPPGPAIARKPKSAPGTDGSQGPDLRKI